MSANRLPEAKKPQTRLETRTVVEYFHPREHAILAEYFELKKKLPKEAKKIDPHEIIPKDTGWDEGEQGIVCRPGSRGEDCPFEAIRNAVARIALAPIRKSLPVWGTYGNGEVYHTRQEENTGKLPLRGFHSETRSCPDYQLGDFGTRGTVGRRLTTSLGFLITNVTW